MSSFVYGNVTAQRAAAPAKKSKTAVPPGMGTYLDTLAALVPAEALALYEGVVLPNTTKTVSGKTVISHSTLLGWSCAGLLVLSVLLYGIGRKKQNWSSWDVARLFIPPAALTAWMLVQSPGVWDVWWPGPHTAERLVIAAFAAVVLGIAAKALGNLEDQAPGTLAVTDVSPDIGSTAGGARVTVTGSGFTGATSVNFGGTKVDGPKVSGDTKLTVTSPPGAPGPVQVTVTTPSGTSPTSTADQFTYEPPPVVTGVNPDGGPDAGSQNVTVTGSGFTGATRVRFGKAEGRNLAVTNDTTLTVTSPAAKANGAAVHVTVTTPAGTSATSAADEFTYAKAAAGVKANENGKGAANA